MKKWMLCIALALAPTRLLAQTGAVTGFCDQGARHATTSGLPSSNYQQQLIPQCTITVYLTGTTTLATIYADQSNTPLTNPFTADANAQWVFWAATNAGLDIIGSGGQIPNVYSPSIPLCIDCYPSSSFTPVLGSFKTNGVNNASQALLNFVDTATVKFTNPSGGVESATVPNATNSSLGVAQCDGITIKCASGVLSTIPGSGLDMFVNAPTTGTWLPIYPTGYTITGQQTYSTATASNTAGQIVDAGCNGVGTCAQPLLTKVTWTFALPSYINPANVTSVYASGLASTSNWGTGGGYSPSAYLYCYQSTNTYILATGINANSAQQQYNVAVTTGTGSNISTITCDMHVSATDPVQGSITENVPAILLQVEDSVDTPPTSTNVNVLTPLYYNPSTQILGIDPLASFQGLNLLSTAVAGLPSSPTLDATYRIHDGSTSTDCTTGSGSELVDCFWNGSSYSGYAVGGGGSSGSFSGLTSGTNTSATMVVGTGASLVPTSSGVIQATDIAGTISAGTNVTITGSGTTGSPYVIAASGGSSGLSGMTAGQVPIAATATTVTSSKVLAGSGSGITTGPTSSTSGDVATMSGTAGQIADSSVLLSSLAPKASPTFSGTITTPITGSTQCVQANSSGALSGTGSACGTVSLDNLTAAVSGGASPGSTYNGAAAVTFDYHSFGAPGLAASNTYTGSTTNDFSGTSQLKLPVAAGYTAAAQGEIGYDSTNKNFHAWVNGADAILVPLGSGFSSGHCGQPTLSGNSWYMADSGYPCGIGTGGVTSFSGDGALLSNLSSTGTVTATLANAAAYKWWGNNTGSSATPAYAYLPKSVSFTINNGTATSPALPNLNVLNTGQISTCIWTTTTSDASASFVFNILFNGSSIFSGGAQTISAGTSPGTISTLGSLTSTPLTLAGGITSASRFTFNITTGAADWTGVAQCN